MSTPKRKLAAIVFADIAGFTDQANRDEAEALLARERVEKLVKASAVGHNGRVVKSLGDGTMLEFASAVEAVSCALEIQEQMDHHNEEVALAKPIAVRIGVHVGDVVEEDSDLYGNAVNIASRVHAMAKPGGICITREVYVQIRPILKLQCAPVAGSSSDRLPEKVEVFTILGQDTTSATAAKRRTSPIVWLAAAAGIAAIAIAIQQSASPSTALARNEAHRILLPDWVTPGESFTLDAGQSAESLSVYFGNKKANTSIEDGRLVVHTPLDLPTQQTTISVFEGASSKPLLNQQTEVIRTGALAMNTTNRSFDPMGEKGPEVKIGSASPPSKTASKPPANEPPEPPDARPTRVIKFGPPEEMKSYDLLVEELGKGEFEFKAMDDKPMPKLPPQMGKALSAVNIASRGDSEKARLAIREARSSLKDAPPQLAAETESILKTAEAILEDGVRAGSGAPRGGRHGKWGEAFAFSMNHATRNLPGLIMIDKQIRAGNPEEARRAMTLLRSRKDLTASEKRVLDRLEVKLKQCEAAPPPPEQKAPLN